MIRSRALMKITHRTAADANAAYYESMPPGLEDYWNRMAAPRFRTDTLCRLVLDANPTRIAELGCGNGRLLVELGARGYRGQRLGIDLSENRISQNRALLPEIDWFAANLEAPASAIPQETRGVCDAVIACELIEHLADPAALLTNASSLAVPGRGLLFLSTQSGPIGATERFVGHQRHFSAGDLAELLGATGWEVVRVWNAGYPFHDLSKWFASLRPDTMIEQFSNKAYGPAQRLVCWSLRALFKLNSQTRGAQLFAVARARA